MLLGLLLKKNAYRILVGRCEWKRRYGKPRHRREDNIEIGLIEKYKDSITIAHGRTFENCPINTFTSPYSLQNILFVIECKSLPCHCPVVLQQLLC